MVGIINLKTHKLLNWKLEYGDLYLQAGLDTEAVRKLRQEESYLVI